MKSWLLWRLPYRHVRAGVAGMIVSVLAVALGVGLTVATRLMNQSVLAAFLETVDGVAGRVNFSVSVGDGLPFSEELVDNVAAVPGVKLAVPLVVGTAFPDDHSGEVLSVYGVDLANDAAVRIYHAVNDSGEVIDDLVAFLNQPDSIVLGREFAERRGLNLQSKLHLITPAGVNQFTVRGILDPQGLARTFGGRFAIMDVYAAERVFTADRQINEIDVLVDDRHDMETVRRGVAGVLPTEFRVDEPAVRKDVIRKTLAGFQAMLTAFSLLAVLAGFVICYSRLGSIFESRTWEIGLLRAVGLRRSVVIVELLKESLILGALGTAIGIPLGIFIGRYGLSFVANATALNFGLPVTEARPRVTVSALVVGAIVGLVASILAALMPALRLARKQPVAALTMRGRDILPPTSRVRWGYVVALLGTIVALVAAQIVSEIISLGNVTTAAVAVAACILARPLVQRGSGLVTPLWDRAFGSVGRFAGQHLGQHAHRATLSVATLGLGLGVVLMFGMLGWSLERTVFAQLAARFRADLVVMSPFLSGGWMAAPVNEAAIRDIETIPGVALVAGQQLKDISFGGQQVSLFSYDGVCFRDRRMCRWPLTSGALPDALRSVAAGEAVLVSASMARQNHVRPGDQLELASPNGLQRIPVAAVAAEEPGNAIIIARERYRSGWNDAGVRWVHVVLEPNVVRSAVEAAIRQHVGEAYRLQVQPVSAFVDYLAGQVRQAFSVLYLMEGVIFVLVLIGVGDALAGAVVEHTREFGMMRAIGLRRSRLVAMVLLEGLALGVLGLLLAFAAGLGLGLFWVKIQFPAILGWNLRLYFPAAFAVGAAVLTLVLCLLASIGPSLRAAWLPVPSALRND